MRYGPYPYYGWNDFHSASAFNAHYLAAYPPPPIPLIQMS